MTSPLNEKLKILVVDDDEMNRRMMQLILTREDHDVQLARDGFEACDAAKTQHFDIILMDLQMPDMDGIETSRRIRAIEKSEGRQSYIVALTASFLPEKGSELFEAGIDNYIAKPFDIEHLRQMLEYGLDHWSQDDVQTSAQEEPGNDSDSDDQESSELSFDPELGTKRVGGDSEVFHEFISDFMEELPKKVNAMKDHLAKMDMEGLSRSAHNLKGISANLGILQLSQYAGNLENSAGEGYTESVRLELEHIEKVAEKFLQDASRFLSNTGD